MNELYLLGAGDFGREVAWLVERANQREPMWQMVGFWDDDRSKTGTVLDGFPVLGTLEDLSALGRTVWTVCCIGSARARQRAVARVRRYAHIRFATLVDPCAVVGRGTTLAEGCIICAGAVITVGCRIGPHTHINLNCTVGHDTVLTGCDTLYPGAHLSGRVHVGECVEIGTGASVLPGKRICAGAAVGAGAVVVGDLAEPVAYGGVPARKLS